MVCMSGVNLPGKCRFNPAERGGIGIGGRPGCSVIPKLVGRRPGLETARFRPVRPRDVAVEGGSCWLVRRVVDTLRSVVDEAAEAIPVSEVFCRLCEIALPVVVVLILTGFRSSAGFEVEPGTKV